MNEERTTPVYTPYTGVAGCYIRMESSQMIKAKQE
jgi:hypothetical protein